jgi:hypothetical protein
VPRVLHVWVAALGALACSAPERPPTLGDDTPASDSGSDPVIGSGGSGGGACVDDAATPPLPDALGFCGNTFLRATTDPPNVYFVIDRSGSMQEVVGGRMKYDAVASASVALVRRLGSQVNVGAAVFPATIVNPDATCETGVEVFATRPGDPLSNSTCNTDGDVTRAFSRSITLASGTLPLGGTPTGATLARLLPTLTALPGRTAVILATDGGPNCNPDAKCDASKCIPNIERDPACVDGVNCCGPALGGPTACLDDVATLSAVRALAERGIKTYVVGIPGSAPYASLLEEMARSGGTPRPPGSSAVYYEVDQLTELDDILAAIGGSVVLSCHLHLEMPPRERSLVNVYLDRQLVQYGAPDGWVWTNPGDAGALADRIDEGDAIGGHDDANHDAIVEDTTAEDAESQDGGEMDAVTPDAVTGVPRQDLDLLGASCELLLSGKIRQVQVVFGCPTVTPK